MLLPTDDELSHFAYRPVDFPTMLSFTFVSMVRYSLILFARDFELIPRSYNKVL
jgi:hypothetical protein